MQVHSAKKKSLNQISDSQKHIFTEYERERQLKSQFYTWNQQHVYTPLITILPTSTRTRGAPALLRPPGGGEEEPGHEQPPGNTAVCIIISYYYYYY